MVKPTKITATSPSICAAQDAFSSKALPGPHETPPKCKTKNPGPMSQSASYLRCITLSMDCQLGVNNTRSENLLKLCGSLRDQLSGSAEGEDDVNDQWNVLLSVWGECRAVQVGRKVVGDAQMLFEESASVPNTGQQKQRIVLQQTVFSELRKIGNTIYTMVNMNSYPPTLSRVILAHFVGS